MIKNKKYLTFIHSINFNGIQIKLNSNKKILTKRSHIKKIFLSINYVADSTSSKKIIKKNYYSKNYT